MDLKTVPANDPATTSTSSSSDLPELLRIRDITSSRKNGRTGLLPLSRSTWWSGVKSGKYPQPIYLSDRMPVWRRSDIVALISGLS